MTGELVVDFITSLDGYASAEGWPGWWGIESPEYLAWIGEQSGRGYSLLMGARTYRLMHSFAAQPEVSNPNATEEETAATTGLTAMPKIVVSNSLPEPLEWANSTLVRGDAAEEVARLKREGVNLSTIGSLSLCRSLLQAGLVDRFRVVIFPVITGATGRERIYDGYPDVGLEMVDHRTFDDRVQLVEYRPTLLDGPPRPGPERTYD